MGFGGKTSLKFFTRLNLYKNSGETCRIVSDGQFWKAYSYREVIFYYDEKLKKYVFNKHKFSSTTSAHQSCLWSILGDKILKKDIPYFSGIQKNADLVLYVDFTSINDGLDFSKLNEVRDNIIFCKEFFSKKELKEFTAKVEKNESDKKESLKIDRLYKSLKDINYATKVGFLKAAKTYKNLTKNEVKINDKVNDFHDYMKALSIGFTDIELNDKKPELLIFTFSDFLFTEKIIKLADENNLLNIYKTAISGKNKKISWNYPEEAIEIFNNYINLKKMSDLC